MTNTILVFMVNLSLSKEELDVVYYALKRFSVSKRETAETFQKAAKVTNFASPKFIESQLKESAIAEKLCDDFINLMLDMLKH